MNKLFIFCLLLLVAGCFTLEDNSGETSYRTHCASCHGVNGLGFQKLYPPLKGADYLAENFERTICIVKYGLDDTISVNGIDYAQPMMPVQGLSDEELVNIMNYIGSTMVKPKKQIDLESLRAQIMSCK